MRSAKAQDYWRNVYQRRYAEKIIEIDLNGLNNINKIVFPTGILAICGLNGAGKSTIISAAKDILGIPLNGYDIHRLGNAEVSAIFDNHETMVHCSNANGKRLVDHGWETEKICYLDCAKNSFIQDYLISLPDLDELLDQFDEYEFSEEELSELNNILGKHYSFCGIRMLDDVSKSGSIPYCRVMVGDIEYDSRGMGSGEHFLCYLFWSIKSVERGSILIVEEPETFVSISSQERLLNFLAKQISEKGLSVIITTHSPYILKQIKNENIRMVSRMKNSVDISTPGELFSVEELLGMKSTNKGTLFVEDRLAADFLSVYLEDCAPNILREYTIDIVGGESEITSRLKFPKSDKIKYNFVGVYDGDMREKLDNTELQWKHCFLPGDKPLEIMFQEFAEQDTGMESLSEILKKNKSTLFAYLASIEGVDYHDWFEELRKLLNVDGKALVRAFYVGMRELFFGDDAFLNDLKQCI